jgi:glycosyltransferase involved in cell wall biosynthesis
MILGKKLVVVLPAYNASRTLEKTYREIPFDLVDDVVLTDDQSKDDTIALAKELGIKHIVVHEKNRGYGGNQKSCYNKALELGADMVIMLHPDSIHPKLIRSMAYIMAEGLYPVVFGSRILGKGALNGGMPWYKYVANRVLTLTQNILMNQKLSEYHTGYRIVHTRRVGKRLPTTNSPTILYLITKWVAQIFKAGFEIAEITCPTEYFEEASSINFKRSAIYGIGVLKVSLLYRLSLWGMCTPGYLKGLRG